jgi:hypothetical protein
VDDEDEDLDSVLALIKSAPGNVSPDSMLTEISKLTAIRAVGQDYQSQGFEELPDTSRSPDRLGGCGAGVNVAYRASEP